MRTKVNLRNFCILIIAIVISVGYGRFGYADSFRLEKGNLIRIIQLDVDPANEKDFFHWYLAEHEHLLLKVPGVIWTYKGINVGQAGPKYFFMYLHKSSEVQMTEQYKAASQTEWAKKVRPVIMNFQAYNYEVIHEDTIHTYTKPNNIIRTVKADILPEKEKSFNEWYNNEHIPLLKEVPGVISIWRGINKNEKGQKYINIYFQEDISIQQREEYKMASQTEWIKSLMPFIKDLQGTNYSIPIY